MWWPYYYVGAITPPARESRYRTQAYDLVSMVRSATGYQRFGFARYPEPSDLPDTTNYEIALVSTAVGLERWFQARTADPSVLYAAIYDFGVAGTLLREIDRGDVSTPRVQARRPPRRRTS